MKYWPYPKLFAHRGGGSLAPENTLAGMKMAQHYLYAAVEFDVKLSADGIAMLMHDDTLTRTTNGTGAFKDKTAAELEKLDAGSWLNTQFAGEKIPRFSAAMHYLHSQGMNVNIEIKPCTGREVETGQRIAELAGELTREHVVKPILTSFSVAALRAARVAAPNLPMGLLVEKYLPEHDAILDELNCASIGCEHSNVSTGMVRHLHDRGVHVMAFTANRVDLVAALFDLGVDGVFTDQLDLMAHKFPSALLGR